MGVAARTPAGPSRPAVVSERTRRVRWSRDAWAAIALTAAFVAATCWWVAVDRSLPGTEAGSHLGTTLQYRDMLASGDLLGPVTADAIHPPLVFLLGAVAQLVGGIEVAPPVVAQNLVFVPLLALGCYRTAALGWGTRAGALAVAFALGSPLLIEQFHVFMLDAPLTALVAVALWLLLACERFARVGTSALAGAVLGLGMLVKPQFPLFVAGLLAVVLLRERGWRNRRGIAAFVVAAVAVGAPWYLLHLGSLGDLADAPVASAEAGTLPPLLSLTNLTWYAWAALASLLFAPLSALAAVGVVRTAASPRRPRIAPELLGGLLGGWLLLLVTPVHVVRYALPLLVYLAVLGTGWIVELAPRPRRVANAALALAVALATLGATFGVPGDLRVRLGPTISPTAAWAGVAPRNELVVYSDRDFQVAGPQREGRMLALMRALRRDGVTGVTWLQRQVSPAFEDQGLHAFAAMARLSTPLPEEPLPTGVAVLLHGTVTAGAPPCVLLADGSGVWIRLEHAADPRQPLLCPLRRPSVYGP